jgi:uncharacterized protein (TIGR00730 family)
MSEQPTSPTPPKAYKDLEFLNSHEARSIRVLCELMEPERRLKQQKVQHTVVLFGSARSVETTQAEASATVLRQQAAQASDPAIRASLEQKADYLLRLSKYHDAAIELSRRVTEWSLTIPRPEDRFYICSGGGPGMMEAANKGAYLAGGKSVGLGISLPFEQHINPYTTPELAFEYHYFFMRKYWFLYLAKALVVFPGGFGTMDELFEMLTLIQTKKSTKDLPIVLFGAEFWNDILNFEAFKRWGVISEGDLNLFKIMDDVEETANYLITAFGKNRLRHSF